MLPSRVAYTYKKHVYFSDDAFGLLLSRLWWFCRSDIVRSEKSIAYIYLFFCEITRFDLNGRRRSWMQQLGSSSRQVAMMMSVRHSATCTGFVCRCAYLAVMVYQCVRGLGPTYLANAIQLVAWIPGRQHLQSSLTSAVDVPSTRLCTVGVCHRRRTNMEQFVSWSNVIKFPANLQNQTKISFVG